MYTDSPQIVIYHSIGLFFKKYTSSSIIGWKHLMITKNDNTRVKNMSLHDHPITDDDQDKKPLPGPPYIGTSWKVLGLQSHIFIAWEEYHLCWSLEYLESNALDDAPNQSKSPLIGLLGLVWAQLVVSSRKVGDELVDVDPRLYSKKFGY